MFFLVLAPFAFCVLFSWRAISWLQLENERAPFITGYFRQLIGADPPRRTNFWSYVVCAPFQAVTHAVCAPFAYIGRLYTDRCVQRARQSHKSGFISAGSIFAAPAAGRDGAALGNGGVDTSGEVKLTPELEARLSGAESGDTGDVAEAVAKAEEVKKKYGLFESVQAIVVTLILIRAIRWLLRRKHIEKESVKKAIANLDTLLDWLETLGDVTFVFAFMWGFIPRELRDGTAVIRVMRKLVRKDPKADSLVIEDEVERLEGAGLGFETSSWYGWLTLAKKYKYHVLVAGLLFLLAAVLVRKTTKSEEVPDSDIPKRKAKKLPPGVTPTTPLGQEPTPAEKRNGDKLLRVKAINIGGDCKNCKKTIVCEVPVEQAFTERTFTQWVCPECEHCNVFGASGIMDISVAVPMKPDSKEVAVPEAEEAKMSRADRRKAKKAAAQNAQPVDGDEKKKKAPAHGGHVYSDDKPKGGRLGVPERAQATPPFDSSRTGEVPLYDANGVRVASAGAINWEIDGKSEPVIVTVKHALQEPVYFDQGGKIQAHEAAVLVLAPNGDHIVRIAQQKGSGFANPSPMPPSATVTKLDKPSSCVIWHSGKISSGSVSPSGDGRLVHNCSTVPGWSGSLIFASINGAYRAVGLHAAADNTSSNNLGVSFFRLN